MVNTTNKMTNRPRLQDIAQIAGVSRISVAKVLLGTGKNNVRVSKETSERIQRIAKELNYTPNFAARQLAGKRSKTIGVIVSHFGLARPHEIKLAEMEHQASLRGYKFVTTHFFDDLHNIQSYITDLTAHGVEGLICPYWHSSFEANLERFSNKSRHIVLTTTPEISDDRLCFVDIDRSQGYYDIFSHLVSRGRQRIGLLLGNLTDFSLRERYRGYIQALREYGRPELLACFPKHPTSSARFWESEVALELIEASTRKLIEEMRVDAIITSNDMVAGGVIKVIRTLHLRVPEDIAVVGFDNLPFGCILDPSLTTLDPRSKEQGQIAINMLIDMIEGKEIPREKRQIILKPELVIRQST